MKVIQQHFPYIHFPHLKTSQTIIFFCSLKLTTNTKIDLRNRQKTVSNKGRLSGEKPPNPESGKDWRSCCWTWKPATANGGWIPEACESWLAGWRRPDPSSTAACISYASGADRTSRWGLPLCRRHFRHSDVSSRSMRCSDLRDTRHETVSRGNFFASVTTPSIWKHSDTYIHISDKIYRLKSVWNSKIKIPNLAPKPTNRVTGTTIRLKPYFLF